MTAPEAQRPLPGRIGRYTVERFLARGGMAEVFLGKAEGPGGFAKDVVIKRILPDLAEDERFVRMFLDEARLAAQLNHPNIVQVYDFGQEGGVYFLAMEYIQGESLRAILRVHRSRGDRLPPAICAKVISGVCDGLHYAHGLTDEHGVSRNLVHRDVTPDNILVSLNGVPKIVDFGIAKAGSSAAGTRTESGQLKGKYGYMSPEQIRGDGIDRRLDVYALGVTLYEMLAGERPYRAENELQLLRQIIAAKAPALHEVDPAIPPELSRVVAQAMAPDPAQRYPDARALQMGLEDFLAGIGARIAPFELAAVVSDAAQYRRERDPIAEPAATPSGPRGVPGFPGAPGDGRVEGQVATVASAAPRPEAPPSTPPRGRFPRWAQGVTGAGLALLGLLGAWWLRRGPAPTRAPRPPAAPLATVIRPPPPAPATEVAAPEPAPAPKPAAAEALLTVRAEPGSEVRLDGRLLGTAPLRRAHVPAGKHELVVARRDGTAERRERLDLAPNGARTVEVVFGKGLLDVRVLPWADVSVDGHHIGQTPFPPLALTEGRHLVKLVNGKLGRRETRVVEVRKGGRATVKVLW